MTNQILWEERNLIEPPMNYEIKEEQETNDITKRTKISLMPSDWRSITDPKLRRKAYYEAYYEANKDKLRAYYQENKDKIKVRGKAYRQEKKAQKEAHDESLRAATLNKIKRDKVRQDKDNAKASYQYKTDVQYRLSKLLRSRLFRALKSNQKTGSAVRDLGCSIPEFKTYLESKFQSGMDWDNQGEWHIDHIKPLASFDLTNREQLLIACHYSNLQPLWATENMIKSDNWTA